VRLCARRVVIAVDRVRRRGRACQQMTPLGGSEASWQRSRFEYTKRHVVSREGAGKREAEQETHPPLCLHFTLGVVRAPWSAPPSPHLHKNSTADRSWDRVAEG